MSLIVTIIRGSDVKKETIVTALNSAWERNIVIGINAMPRLFAHYANELQRNRPQPWEEDELRLAASPEMTLLSDPADVRSSSEGSQALYFAEEYFTHNGERHGFLLQFLRATRIRFALDRYGSYLHSALTSYHFHPLNDPNCPNITESFYPIFGACHFRTTRGRGWENLNKPIDIPPGVPHALRCDDEAGACNLIHSRPLPEGIRVREVPHRS